MKRNDCMWVTWYWGGVKWGKMNQRVRWCDVLGVVIWYDMVLEYMREDWVMCNQRMYSNWLYSLSSPLPFYILSSPLNSSPFFFFSPVPSSLLSSPLHCTSQCLMQIGTGRDARSEAELHHIAHTVAAAFRHGILLRHKSRIRNIHTNSGEEKKSNTELFYLIMQTFSLLCYYSISMCLSLTQCRWSSALTHLIHHIPLILQYLCFFLLPIKSNSVASITSHSQVPVQSNICLSGSERNPRCSSVPHHTTRLLHSTPCSSDGGAIVRLTLQGAWHWESQCTYCCCWCKY